MNVSRVQIQKLQGVSEFLKRLRWY